MPGPPTQHRFQGALEEKHCSGCDEWKVLKAFSKDEQKSDGLEGRCKVCRNIAREKQRQEVAYFYFVIFVFLIPVFIFAFRRSIILTIQHRYFDGITLLTDVGNR